MPVGLSGEDKDRHTGSCQVSHAGRLLSGFLEMLCLWFDVSVEPVDSVAALCKYCRFYIGPIAG